jgi:hypothetical protein
MVAFNTLFTSFAALASIAPLVSGAAVPQNRQKDSSISRRETTWDEYHATNRVFAEQGLCRYYIDPTGRDGLWPCRQYCKSDSVTCNGSGTSDPSTIHANPDGERYTYGECWCSNPALELVVKFTAEGLQELPAITCAVWLEALKQSVFLGTSAIPGVGPVAEAAKWIIRSVSLADKLGGKEGWTNFIKDTCKIDQWDFDMSKAFDIFQSGSSARRF